METNQDLSPQAQAAKWEASLMRGEITINEALSMCMALGVPIPEFIRESYERAWIDYQDGKVTDLAKALGFPVTQRDRQTMETKVRDSHARFLVNSFADQGFPRSRERKFGNTAFDEAGKLLKRSPTTVFDIYYPKKSRRKK